MNGLHEQLSKAVNDPGCRKPVRKSMMPLSAYYICVFALQMLYVCRIRDMYLYVYIRGV